MTCIFDGDNMVYLPKDRVIQMKKPIENPSEIVLPSQVVEHFIQKSQLSLDHGLVHLSQLDEMRRVPE